MRIAHRRDGVDDLVRRVDRRAIADHAPREDRDRDPDKAAGAALDGAKTGLAQWWPYFGLERGDRDQRGGGGKPSLTSVDWVCCPLEQRNGRAGPNMGGTTKAVGAQREVEDADTRIRAIAAPGKEALMLPIAVLPAAGILLRLGQDDLLGGADQGAGDRPVLPGHERRRRCLFSNLALLFAVGVAIGFARKADGSTALSAVVGYLVMQAVFKTMSPFVLDGRSTRPGTGADQHSVLGGIVVVSHHRVPVRPLPHHPIAAVSGLLRRRPPVRAHRGVGDDCLLVAFA